LSFSHSDKLFANGREFLEAKLEELDGRLVEVNDLMSASGVLEWDQLTYMPPGGAPARARQIGTLRELAHQKFTDPAIGKLLEDLGPFEESLHHHSDEACLIRATRQDYEKATRVPPSFMARVNSHRATSYQAWIKARPANDFCAMVPYLEKMIDLSREFAGFFSGYENIADPLIDFYAREDIQVSTMRELFAALRDRLVPMLQAIAAQPAPDDSFLYQNFAEADQLAFSLEVARRFGFDFDRGRQDQSAHPFTTEFALSGDVRMTTRVQEDDLKRALFATMHETGHSLYEQGIRSDLEGTTLGNWTSYGVHESQSRMWENLVGRSRGFWKFFYPKLQAVFASQLGSVSLDAFYRAINKVKPSPIRIGADEVTYNLHIMLRLDFEQDLLEGRLAVRDLPEAWRERFRADFGIVPPDDRDGVLQDMHWYGGILVGTGFQAYTLGNIMSAQFFEAALRAHPEIAAQIEQGEFGTLRGWLEENIYQHGRKFTASELVERATGGPLSIQPFVRYLQVKYGELYEL
jgi:carboxypeptidase Taq